ncbi:hypothetical protein F0U59_49715 [Archangium gephyra]|nr:hypothetical protein F0U59_49715 [Archangium gephyra]
MSGPPASTPREESFRAPPAPPQPANTLVPGLSGAEAARRLAEHGRNEIQREQTRSPWGCCWDSSARR